MKDSYGGKGDYYSKDTGVLKNGVPLGEEVGIANSKGSNNAIEDYYLDELQKSPTATTVAPSFETFDDESECYDDGQVDQDDSKNCLGIVRTLFVILTILIILITGTGIGFALFPRTRFWSYVICLPLLGLVILSWVALMCFVSDDEEESMGVLESSNLPVPEPEQNELEEINLSNENTVASSDLTELAPEKSEFERNFPEIAKMLFSFKQSIDESKDYIIRRVVRPATTLCRPPAMLSQSSIPRGRSRSFAHARSLSAQSLSVGRARSIVHIINEPDIECCTDVYCLRDENGVVNLSGKWKLIHNENFDLFLKALDIPALFRKAANAARPIHKYTHNGDIFRVQFEGIVKGDTTFTVNGTPTISTLRHIKFLDHVSYLEDKDGIVVRKVVQNQTNQKSDSRVVEIIVTRKLSKSGKKLFLISEAIQADGVIRSKSVQTFLRM